MTRRTSTRALAREIYCAQARGEEEATPLPNPQGGPAESGEGAEQSLTEKVRALYEGSAVPVAEIARLAGVTERTIYKYAAKHAWKPRYRWAPNRGWRARPKFAPAQGAGGRFVRRADKGQPFANGLKALEPAAAARAAAECRRAQAQARLAQAEAEDEQRHEDFMRAGVEYRRTLDELGRYQAEQAKLPPAQREPAGDPIIAALLMCIEDTGDWWRELGRLSREGRDRTAALRAQGEADERGAIGTSYERASGTA